MTMKSAASELPYSFKSSMNDTKLSATALLIAKSQLLLAEEALTEALVDAERVDHYRSFIEAAIGAPWRLSLPRRWWLETMERISIPGIYLHYALRKRCIEQVAASFLTTAPTGQVVAIAAGSDPLLPILSGRFEGARFFELDHPATQRAKKSALESRGRPANLILLSIDLAKKSLREVLRDMPFSPGEPVLFIAEGITMYLAEDAVKRLFRELRSCAGHEDSRFLFTYMQERPFGSIQFESATRLVNWWLWLKNEPFRWGIATDKLPVFLAGLGYDRIADFDADDLTRFLTAASPRDIVSARGENICLARAAC